MLRAKQTGLGDGQRPEVKRSAAGSSSKHGNLSNARSNGDAQKQAPPDEGGSTLVLILTSGVNCRRVGGTPAPNRCAKQLRSRRTNHLLVLTALPDVKAASILPTGAGVRVFVEIEQNFGVSGVEDAGAALARERAPPSIAHAGDDPVRLWGFLTDAGLSPAEIANARRAADASGTALDLWLIRTGALDAIALYRALAQHLKVPFTTDPGALMPASRTGARIETVLAAGFAARRGGGYALAPTGPALTRLLARDRRAALTGTLVTLPARLRQGLIDADGQAVHARACRTLPPTDSARAGLTRRQSLTGLALVAGVGFAAMLDSSTTVSAFAVLLGMPFFALVLLRLVACLASLPQPDRPLAASRPRSLPTYTILVPLYREADVLPDLTAALAALRYPPERLQILLLLEADDVETHDCVRALDVPGTVEVLVAPPGWPRTKPRALNTALPFVTGTFCVVYDAEDVPHPDQLRRAVSAFAQTDDRTACFQARLAIDNVRDSWLTRFFAIEYAILFDLLLPVQSSFDLPILLGGTSNHFRTAALREAGGWDAWNVTEDADLGLRLARRGWRVRDLPSTTHEEAPARLRGWFAQRVRWMKGLMQTSAVHLRRPGQLFERLGPGGAMMSVVHSLGCVLTALFGPVFVLVAMRELATGRLLAPGDAGAAVVAASGLVLLAAGALAALLPATIAIRRRRLPVSLPWLALLPLYYLLVSAAAWAAVVELLVNPFRWNKTAHGLARTSTTGVLRIVPGGSRSIIVMSGKL